MQNVYIHLTLEKISGFHPSTVATEKLFIRTYELFIRNEIEWEQKWTSERERSFQNVICTFLVQIFLFVITERNQVMLYNKEAWPEGYYYYYGMSEVEWKMGLHFLFGSGKKLVGMSGRGTSSNGVGKQTWSIFVPLWNEKCVCIDYSEDI